MDKSKATIGYTVKISNIFLKNNVAIIVVSGMTKYDNLMLSAVRCLTNSKLLIQMHVVLNSRLTTYEDAVEIETNRVIYG